MDPLTDNGNFTLCFCHLAPSRCLTDKDQLNYIFWLKTIVWVSNKINTYWICKSDGITATHLNNDEYFLWGHKRKNTQ